MLTILKHTGIGCAVLVSFICMLLSYAPLTPAISVSFFMLLLTGLIGYWGWIQSSLLLLLINTLAVLGSPGTNMGNVSTMTVVLCFFLAAFAGIAWGVKALKEQNAQSI